MMSRRGLSPAVTYDGYAINQFVTLGLDDLFSFLFCGPQSIGNNEARSMLHNGANGNAMFDHVVFFRGEMKVDADSSRIQTQQDNTTAYKKADAVVRTSDADQKLLFIESGPKSGDEAAKETNDRWILQKKCASAFVVQCAKQGGYSADQEVLACQTIHNRFYIYSLSTDYADVMMWCELARYTLPVEVDDTFLTLAEATDAMLDLVSASMALAERIVKQVKLLNDSSAIHREFLLKNVADVVAQTPIKPDTNNKNKNNTGSCSSNHLMISMTHDGLVLLDDNFGNLRRDHQYVICFKDRAVRHVSLLSTGETVVLKTYQNEPKDDGGKYEAMQLIRLQQFPFVVRMLDSFSVLSTNLENWRYALVLEQLQPLPPFASMSLEFVESIINQLLQALAALHQHSIVHMDIKPANLMLTMDSDAMNDARSVKLKLIDFEFATVFLSRDGLPVQGTRGFIAPELQGR
jgi:hypothetical protein